jgi:hypothetical protein
MNLYTRKELVVMSYVAGLVTGLLFFLASCSPSY